MKSENYEICHDIISGCCGKKLRRFCKNCHICWLQDEASSKKFQRVVNDSLKFCVKVTIKSRFDSKTFCIGNGHDGLFYVNFLSFFESI